MAKFLRGYVLDHGDTSPMFGIVRRRAAERSLSSPQADTHAVWALATLAALLSGDWLNAPRLGRQPRPYRVSARQKYSTPAASVTIAQPAPASHSSPVVMSGWQYACSAGIFFALKTAHRTAL